MVAARCWAHAVAASVLYMGPPCVSQFLAPRNNATNMSHLSGADVVLEGSVSQRSLGALDTAPATCDGLGMETILSPADNGACGEAVVDAFSDLFEKFGSVVTGGIDTVDGWETASSGIKAVGAVLGVVLPFPAKLLSHVVFSIVGGLVRGVDTAATSASTQGWAAVQKLFRHRFRSNRARYVALKEEWSWYKDLFSKEFLNEHGENYEAVALSWLLNVQHDAALDKELFFNADCLGVTDQQMFTSVTEGTCEDFGMFSISDAALCEVASVHVKGHTMNASSNVGSVAEKSRPQGCYWLGDLSKPFLNSETDVDSGADANRQSLCTSMSKEVQDTCSTWQQSSSWKVSKWYAALHLSVLLDIMKNYPPLRKSVMPKIVNVTKEYEFLLTHSYKASVDHRFDKTFMSEPVVKKWHDIDGGVTVNVKCATAGWGRQTMVKEGRDYWHKRLGPNSDDQKCRGACDVMSTDRCKVRPVNGTGLPHSKYCVSADDVQVAEGCWRSYKASVLEEMQGEFAREIEHLKQFQQKLAGVMQEL